MLPTPAPSPAKPEMLALKTRPKNAPRIVAVLFWQGEDESHPLFALENGDLQVWDLQSDEWHAFPARRLFRRSDGTRCAAFSPECAILATGHQSGQVRLQSLETGAGHADWKIQALETLETHHGCVLSLALAQTRLYSAGSDGAVVLTILPSDARPKSSAELDSRVILDGLGALSCLAVSPDGHWMALGADDGQVQIWHLSPDGTPIRLDWTSGKDFSAVKSLGFSPNGNMLLSRNARGEGCLWAARTGHRLQVLTPRGPLVAAAFAGDSRLLAYAGASDGISLCDAWTGAVRHTLPIAAGEVQALGFSPPTETEAQETQLIVAASQQILAWKVSF